jgi:hypothetical protein
MGAVCYQRSGFPDTGVRTSRFEPLSRVSRASGPRGLGRRLEGRPRELQGALEHLDSGSQRNQGPLSVYFRGVLRPNGPPRNAIFPLPALRLAMPRRILEQATSTHRAL